jgi:YVTN family beta-propeller protein
MYVSNESLNTVDVIRASDHVRIASVPTISAPYGLAITADDKRVYVSSFDGHTISAFDTETNALVSTLSFGSELREIALTPDERFLYVPDYNQNVVHVVSTRSDTLVGDIPVGINPHMVAFGGSGRYAYVTNEASASVSVIDTQTRTTINTIPVGQTPIGIAASPDTETIYVADSSAGEVSCISVKSQSVVATVSVPSSPSALAVSPDGKYIYLVAENPASGYVISVASQAVVGTFPVGTQPRNIVVTSDGGTIYETNFDSHDLYAVNAHSYQLEYVKTLGSLDGVAFSSAAKPIINGYRFQTIDFPGAIETDVAQSNDAGSIRTGSIMVSFITKGTSPVTTFPGHRTQPFSALTQETMQSDGTRMRRVIFRGLSFRMASERTSLFKFRAAGKIIRCPPTRSMASMMRTIWWGFSTVGLTAQIMAFCSAAINRPPLIIPMPRIRLPVACSGALLSGGS